jgi:DNA polymerase III delta prime subunit
LWIRDRAPNTIGDVIGNKEIRDIFLRFLEVNNIPNILLFGAHGTCKRTLAKLLVTEYLGQNIDRACLVIDGAIYRGKDVISCNDAKKGTKKTDKLNYPGPTVTEFCRTKLTLPEGKKKIVMIYNFEDMTSDAQNALRRIIETHIEITRFILICNELCNVIEPIQSRCTPLTTRPFIDADGYRVIDHLKMDHLDAEIKKTILMLSDGDMKKLINYLQVCASIDDITIDKFYGIFNIPSVRYIEELLKDCGSDDVLDRVTYLIHQGYGYNDILEMLCRIITRTDVITLPQKVMFMEILTKYYTRLSAMVSPIHLYALFSEFSERALLFVG